MSLIEILLLALTSISIFTSTQAQYQWSCSPLDTANNRYLLPDLGIRNDGDAADNRELLRASADAVYVFPLPSSLNCSGRVSALQYCYEGSNLGTEQSIFRLIILQQSGSTFTVNNTVLVRSTPSDQICTRGFVIFLWRSVTHCCDTLTLEMSNQFNLPASNFAFGTISINGLFAYLPTVTPLDVDHYRFDQSAVSTTVGSTISVGTGNLRSDRTVRLLQFYLTPFPTTEPPTTSEATTEPPTTSEATTEPPTTSQATTQPPTTSEATTEAPTTSEATTEAPTTSEATTQPPTTSETTTEPPTTSEPTIEPPTTSEATTQPPTTSEATTQPPTTSKATTEAPTTSETTTEPPTTSEATTEPPIISEAITQPPTTSNQQAPTTAEPKATESSASTGSTRIMETRAIVGTTKATTGDVDSPSVVGVAVGVVVGVGVALLLVGVIIGIVVVAARRRSSWKLGHSDTGAGAGLSFRNEVYEMAGENETTGQYDSVQYDKIKYDSVKYDYAGVGPHGDGRKSVNEYEKPVVSMDTYAYAGAGLKEISGSYDTLQHSSMKAKEASTWTSESIYMVPGSDEHTLYAQLDEIRTDRVSRETVGLGNLLGSGQFGMVYKGILHMPPGKRIDVAVKTLKEGSGEQDRVKFLQEAAIMGQFKHPNVVTMYGVVTQGEPVLLVLELLSKGDLHDYLLRMRPEEGGDVNINELTLLSYCRQVASGMTYLSSKAFIHRDLAARNILVSDDQICKIADFGMSRDLMDENYYVARGGKIPVKWTAPEALHYKKYSTASDVWSYGALMYEIWSVGHKPFESLTNTQVVQLVDTGFRLAPPPGCPRALYSIMIACWHPTTAKRPSFTDISTNLSLPDSELLKWSEADKSTHPGADKLGADLLLAQDLYRDLQVLYK